MGRYIDLIIYRATAELKAEASRAYLGMVWWVLEPILYLGVFYAIFGLGLRMGTGEHFVAFLLCGLVPWKWLDSSVRTSSGIIASSVGLMGQVYLPKLVLPTVVIVSNTIKFLIILVLFLVFLTLYGLPPALSWFYLPLIVIVQAGLVFVLSTLASAVVPIVPDLRYIVSYGMTLLFFMSGIFFKLDRLSEEVKAWLVYNPVIVIVEAYRDVLIKQQAPNFESLAWLSIAIAFLLIIVLLLYKKLDRYYPRVVG